MPQKIGNPPLLRGFKRFLFQLLARHDHDFDFPAGCGQGAAQSGAHGRVGWVDPGIPNLVHRIEVPHVRDPELRP